MLQVLSKSKVVECSELVDMPIVKQVLQVFLKSKVVERSKSDNMTIVKQMLQVFPCPRSLTFSQCVIIVSSQVAKRSKSVCQ